jgi:hypothetical protein
MLPFFSHLALNDRKIQEYPYHLLKLDDASELAAFLASDITIMTSLYTPLTKYDLFAYLKCSRCMFGCLFSLFLVNVSFSFSENFGFSDDFVLSFDSR